MDSIYSRLLYTHLGFVHDLVFHCIPPPHLRLHEVYSDHELHPPLTGIGSLLPSLTHSP